MCKYACALQEDGRTYSKLMAKKKMVYDGSSLMLWEGNVYPGFQGTQDEGYTVHGNQGTHHKPNQIRGSPILKLFSE